MSEFGREIPSSKLTVLPLDVPRCGSPQLWIKHPHPRSSAAVSAPLRRQAFPKNKLAVTATIALTIGTHLATENVELRSSLLARPI